MKTTIKIKVRGFHIDHSNHVNNARYLEFLEEGRWDYSEKNNLITNFHSKGIGHVTVNANIDYRKSAFAGQVLKIETGVVRKSENSVTMKQIVFLGDSETIIADADVTNVFLDANTQKIMPVNEELESFWSDLKEIDCQETEAPSKIPGSGNIKGP